MSRALRHYVQSVHSDFEPCPWVKIPNVPRTVGVYLIMSLLVAWSNRYTKEECVFSLKTLHLGTGKAWRGRKGTELFIIVYYFFFIIGSNLNQKGHARWLCSQLGSTVPPWCQVGLCKPAIPLTCGNYFCFVRWICSKIIAESVTMSKNEASRLQMQTDFEQWLWLFCTQKLPSVGKYEHRSRSSLVPISSKFVVT